MFWRSTAGPDCARARGPGSSSSTASLSSVGSSSGSSGKRSEEHTSELQSRQYLVCRLLLEKKKNKCEIVRHLALLKLTHRPTEPTRRPQCNSRHILECPPTTTRCTWTVKCCRPLLTIASQN